MISKPQIMVQVERELFYTDNFNNIIKINPFLNTSEDFLPEMINSNDYIILASSGKTLYLGTGYGIDSGIKDIVKCQIDTKIITPWYHSEEIKMADTVTGTGIPNTVTGTGIPNNNGIIATIVGNDMFLIIIPYKGYDQTSSQDFYKISKLNLTTKEFIENWFLINQAFDQTFYSGIANAGSYLYVANQDANLKPIITRIDVHTRNYETWATNIEGPMAMTVVGSYLYAVNITGSISRWNLSSPLSF
jgi:hypothetical protein